MRRQQRHQRRRREWHARRTGVPTATGQQRWDQAYQLLVRWATTTPGALVESVRSARTPARLSRAEVPRDDHPTRPG